MKIEENFSSENRLSGIVVNDEVLKCHQPLLKSSKKLKLLKKYFNQKYLM